MVRAEAEQCGDVARAIQFGVVFQIEQLNVSTDRGRDNGVADVIQFPCPASASHTGGDQVCIEVTAVDTLDSVRRVLVP